VDRVQNCLRHRRYDNEDEADARLKELKVQARNRTLQVYPCKEGGTGHWHIGNPYYRRRPRRRKGRRLAMVEEILAAIMVVIIGGWLVTYFAILVRRAVVHQRELAAKREAIDSQRELEAYIRKVNQATSDEELARLEKERRGEG